MHAYDKVTIHARVRRYTHAHTHACTCTPAHALYNLISRSILDGT